MKMEYGKVVAGTLAVGGFVAIGIIVVKVFQPPTVRTTYPDTFSGALGPVAPSADVPTSISRDYLMRIE